MDEHCMFLCVRETHYDIKLVSLYEVKTNYEDITTVRVHQSPAHCAILSSIIKLCILHLHPDSLDKG